MLGASFAFSPVHTKRATVQVRLARWTMRSTWRDSGAMEARGGCQAGCLLFWREEWLRPASDTQRPAPATTDEAALAILTPKTGTTNDRGESVYRCQATDILRASRPLSKYDPRQYVRDLTSGNVTLRVFLVGLAVFVFKQYQLMTQRVLPRWLRIRGGKPYPFYQGTGTGARTPVDDVAPGQLVEVRQKDEIMSTLSPENRNRSMWFDPEMIPYCGTRARRPSRSTHHR